MEWLTGRNIEQFNGTSYGTWKFRIKSLLEELQVLFVIEEPSPEHPDAVWAAKNSVAKCTIVNFLGDAFLHLAEGSVTAKSIIDSLDKLYEKRSLRTQLTLRQHLFNLKLQPNVSLLQHFTTFDTLIAKLICSGANLDEMDKICHLLMTLPISYKETTATIELLDEDKFNLAFIKTVLLDHEAKMEIDAIRKLKESSNLVPNNKRPANNYANRPSKRRKPNNYYQNTNIHWQPLYSQMYCDYCGRRNHYIQNCRFYNNQMNGGYNVHPNHSRRAPVNGYKGRDFSFMLPHFARKGKKQKKNTSTNNAPIINLTIKQEPVSIKQEPVEIKQEPIKIKQEPAWEEHISVVVKKEPEDQPMTNVTDTPNGSRTSSSKRSRRRRRTRASIIAMHIQADNAAQVCGNQQAATSVQN